MLFLDLDRPRLGINFSSGVSVIKLWTNILLAILVGGVVPNATAQQVFSSDYASFLEMEIDRRISFIEQRLDARKDPASTWFWSWMTINAGSAVGLGVAAGLSDNGGDLVNYASQGALAVFGVCDLLLRPVKARHGAKFIRNLPAATRTEKLLKLRRAEDLLRYNAERASERRSWVAHVANLLLNAAAGAATGLAGAPEAGAVNAGTDFLIGEVYLFTEPKGPRKDWEDYKTQFFRRSTKGLRFTVEPLPMGLIVKVTW